MADFRLIDPPRVSPKPVAPNRLLLLPLALLAGLAAGLGLTFVLSQLRPSSTTPRPCSESLGVPLLGVVSLVMDEGQTQRRSNRAETVCGCDRCASSACLALACWRCFY